MAVFSLSNVAVGNKNYIKDDTYWITYEASACNDFSFERPCRHAKIQSSQSNLYNHMFPISSLNHFSQRSDP